MRSMALGITLLLGSTTAVMAQTSYGGDAALTYHWIRTNAPPSGGCGCFDLNGGGVSGSWNLNHRWAIAAEISTEHTGSVLSTGSSLTLTSYQAGARYYLSQLRKHTSHGPQPFAQVLAGTAHADGRGAGDGDGSYAFAIRMGGGIDVPVNSVFAVRVIQIDYDLTKFANGVNHRQNNLLLGAGVVFRWSR